MSDFFRWPCGNIDLDPGSRKRKAARDLKWRAAAQVRASLTPAQVKEEEARLREEVKAILRANAREAEEWRDAA